MSEWKEVKIGDVCSVKRGASPRPIQNFMCKNGMPWVKIADATRSNSRYIYSTEEFITEAGVPKSRTVTPGTLIVSNSATPGLPKIMGITGCVHDGWLIINDFNGVLKEYMYYKFIDIRRVLSNQANGSVFMNLKTDIVKDFPIKVPSIQEQEVIVAFLNNIDAKIECNQKICENLEAQAQALFKHWFIDFAPFKNGNFCANREQNETCFNSAEVQPKITGKACKFVESELGMIPEGWRVGKFTDIFDLGSGGTPKTSEKLYWEDGSIPFFSPKDVNGVYCFDTEKHITEKGLNNCSSSLYSKNTVFITCRGTVGKVAMAAVPMAMNQSNYAILSNKGYSQYFAYLMTVSIVKKLKFKANGAVFDAITSKDFKEQIIIPNLNVVNRFDSIIQPIFDNILNIGFENLRLSTLRDTLLPKLMSGQIKV